MKKIGTTSCRLGLLITLSATLMLSTGCPLMPWFDSDGLITLATGYARQLDPDAIVFSVTGVNGERPDGGGTQTTSYTFLAIDPIDGNATYTITHDLITWTTETAAFPAVGVAYDDLRNVTMTETRRARCSPTRAIPTTSIAGRSIAHLRRLNRRTVHVRLPQPDRDDRYGDRSRHRPGVHRR